MRIREAQDPEWVFYGCWVLPSLTAHGLVPGDVPRTLRVVREGGIPSAVEAGRFCYAVLRGALDELRHTPVRTVQLIVGAEVLPPHQSVTQWHPDFTGAIARLAGEYEDFRFNLSTATDLYTQDLGILAKHVPNVSVAGYWWHTFYPFYIRKSLETRLDMVPLPKIIGFFSDAYHSEWCYPKLRLVKTILHDILVERVQSGWYTLETACSIVEHLFHRNPRRIYGLGEGS